ncbi:MAG: hypothetical protein OXT09_12020 [Myxococcales bacterium]|nr:hypothetical protein [Myxococcales bacterium]
MNRAIAERMTWVITGLGILAAGAAYVAFGLLTARSVAAGAALGVANWMLLRYIVGRVVGGNVKNQAGFTFVLMIKMGALMGLIFILIKAGMVEILPFTLGLSTLMVGVLGGAFFHILTASPEAHAESER